MGKDLISRKSLVEKLENEFFSDCPASDGRYTRDELLKIINGHPAAYDADWVERRLRNLFKHHAATKTVRNWFWKQSGMVILPHQIKTDAAK